MQCVSGDIGQLGARRLHGSRAKRRSAFRKNDQATAYGTGLDQLIFPEYFWRSPSSRRRNQKVSARHQTREKGLGGIVGLTQTLSITASVIGNIPVDQINQDHIRSVLDSFQWWPKMQSPEKSFVA